MTTNFRWPNQLGHGTSKQVPIVAENDRYVLVNKKINAKPADKKRPAHPMGSLTLQ